MRSVAEARLAWKGNAACLRGREGTRRNSHIQERGHLSSEYLWFGGSCCSCNVHYSLLLLF